MYQLHIANKNYSSWSLRPWLLMGAFHIPFEETVVNIYDEAGKKKRGKDGEEAGGAKNVTGLALELQRLEDRLRSTISLEPNKAVDNKRRSVRGSKESRR